MSRNWQMPRSTRPSKTDLVCRGIVKDHLPGISGWTRVELQSPKAQHYKLPDCALLATSMLPSVYGNPPERKGTTEKVSGEKTVRVRHQNVWGAIPSNNPIQNKLEILSSFGRRVPENARRKRRKDGRIAYLPRATIRVFLHGSSAQNGAPSPAAVRVSTNLRYGEGERKQEAVSLPFHDSGKIAQAE